MLKETASQIMRAMKQLMIDYGDCLEILDSLMLRVDELEEENAGLRSALEEYERLIGDDDNKEDPDDEEDNEEETERPPEEDEEHEEEDEGIETDEETPIVKFRIKRKN